MKKPEKKGENIIKATDHYLTSREESYNQAIDDSEKYHAWDIKTNYIRKDRLPSKIKIIGILNKKFGADYLKDIHTGKPIDMTSEIIDTATELSKELSGI